MVYKIPLRREQKKHYKIALKTEVIKKNTIFGTTLDDEFGFYYEPATDLAEYD